MTREQLMEFWHGIVNSKKRFLWVIRLTLLPIRMVMLKIFLRLKEGPKQRGYIVKWAPQEEVLAHKAVDQQVNSRFVSEAWKLGLDMKDMCDRGVVENMVNDLMEDRRDEFVRSTARMAELARRV
ncbi:hypothetical protein GH714_025919 [Hevea brasiliensis]|uniref:Uncharacterized protein n=1 Tax=Hevea brasiliensis TaxID=3981 RepID=A0A6A6L1W8_HEVBR|nr:hypothetical protein GH714_025919 [Hevea brasiliensis]